MTRRRASLGDLWKNFGVRLGGNVTGLWPSRVSHCEWPTGLLLANLSSCSTETGRNCRCLGYQPLPGPFKCNSSAPAIAWPKPMLEPWPALLMLILKLSTKVMANNQLNVPDLERKYYFNSLDIWVIVLVLVAEYCRGKSHLPKSGVSGNELDISDSFSIVLGWILVLSITGLGYPSETGTSDG